MRKIDKVWVVSLLTVLAIAVLGINVYPKVVIDNTVPLLQKADDIYEGDTLTVGATAYTHGSYPPQTNYDYDTTELVWQETVIVPIDEPDGSWSEKFYSGAVVFKVSGTGQSFAHCYNDAFYIYTCYDEPTQHGSLFHRIHIDGTVPPNQPYNPSHTYWIEYDVGETLKQIHFKNQDDYYSDNSGQYYVNIYIRSEIDYIKVFPDSADVCVNGEQQFIAKGYGFGPNGERDGDPDPETYAPAGDDTGPESIEVSWATSVTEEVGTIDESGGLFTAGTTPGSGTVTATYEREGDNSLTDSAEIFVIEVRITGRDFVLCPAPWPGRMPENATQITLEAKGVPSGGEYSWSIICGSDKVELKSENSKAVVKGVNPSDDELDVEVKVTYTLHDCSCFASHKLTVKRPKSAPFDDNYKTKVNRRRRVYYTTVVHTLNDQFGKTIEVEGIPIGERGTRIDGFGIARVGKTATKANGTFKDYLESPLFSESKWRQRIKAGCRVVARRLFGGWVVGRYYVTFERPGHGHWYLITKKDVD